MQFFGGRKNKALEGTIRKIAEVTNPTGDQSKDRGESRIQRILPVLVTPVENGEVQFARSTFGLTKDLSEHGMAIVVSRHLVLGDAIIGLWPTNELVSAASSTPVFFRGVLRSQNDMGAAFVRVGVQLDSVVAETEHDFEALAERAKCLLAPEQLQLLNQKKSALV
jgi:hypothetical protein